MCRPVSQSLTTPSVVPSSAAKSCCVMFRSARRTLSIRGNVISSLFFKLVPFCFCNLIKNARHRARCEVLILFFARLRGVRLATSHVRERTGREAHSCGIDYPLLQLTRCYFRLCVRPITPSSHLSGSGYGGNRASTGFGFSRFRVFSILPNPTYIVIAFCRLVKNIFCFLPNFF